MSSPTNPEPSQYHSNITDHGANQCARRHGRLLALKTKAEVQQAHVQTTQVYITAIPLKAASTVLKVVDSAVHELEPFNIHHLRRFCKPEHLPSYLKHIGEDTLSTGRDTCLKSLIEDTTKGHSDTTNHPVSQPTDTPQQSNLHFLICSTSILSPFALQTLLSATNVPLENTPPPQIRTISVPQNAPTSHEQAITWSQKYWPTVYKGGNPYGPHPAILARATVEIQDEIGEYICLAMRAGLAAREEVGEDIGAVVVDRSGGNGPSVIAVAGDARWNGITGPDEGGNGNAMAHAVMRVIGMVARQRLALLKVPGTLSPGPEGPNLFADKPLTSLEHQIYSASTLAPGGYLCLDLELYLTHEPCVMCSMAIVHSRFGRVIFGQRMPLTGGLAAEMEESDTANAGVHGQGEAYGLWWRPELNWKVLGWQWIDDELSNEALGEQVHA